MIAFVQPFGLEGHGGGARILRSLLKDAPVPYVSVCTSPQPPHELAPGEVHLPVRSSFGRIEHTRFQRYLDHIERRYALDFIHRLEELCVAQDVKAIHAIPHSLDFVYALEVAQRLALPYFLSLHDDPTYNLRGRPSLDAAMRGLRKAWLAADQRFVISDAMGEEYSRRYGERPYSRVTDGLTTVMSRPSPAVPGRLNVYFMGAIHLTYSPNFQVLIDALDMLQSQRPDVDVSLTVRGGFPPDVNPRAVEIRKLGWGTQSDIERDLESADLLYFPLPFDEAYESFVRYSLSTKMVSYLGSGVPILYHGPRRSAAADLLAQYHAAVLAPTSDGADLARIIAGAPAERTNVAEAALSCATTEFMLDEQRDRFWSPIQASLASSSEARGSSHTASPSRRSYSDYPPWQRRLQRAIQRVQFPQWAASQSRQIRLRARGMEIGAACSLGPIRVNWPHQVRVGDNCTFESDVYIKFADYWRPGPSIVFGDRVFIGRGCEFNITHGIELGDDGLIASGCKFIDHNHGTASGMPMNGQPTSGAPIVLETDVWLGVNVTVLQGVRIGAGSIVAAGAVVTCPIPPGEIWGGIPARKLRNRTPADIVPVVGSDSKEPDLTPSVLAL